MFGIGLGEFILILVVALIFISPEKLPEIAKAAAKAFKEFKKAGAEIRRTVSDISFEEASRGRAADLQKVSITPPSPSHVKGEEMSKGASPPEAEKDADDASPSTGANEDKKG